MKELIIAAVLAVLLSLTGCSNLDPEAQRNLTGRSVNLTAWGISGTSPVGTVWNIGWLQYQRNPIQNLEPAKPGIPQASIP